MRPALDCEKAGIPSVVVSTPGFTELAHLTAKAEGSEHLMVAEYPDALGATDFSEIREKVKEILFDRIIDGLTKPIEHGGSTTKITRWNPKEIIFEGTLEQVNKFFSDKGWTDGLPVIPPTIERVQEFLKYTDCSPEEEIAILPQANLKAVPWNIAVNAVMAGCRPEYMPLFIATAEAIGDGYYNLNNIGTTVGVVPYLLINGPIIKQLGIEYAGQLISRGPNPSIGRALGLIIRNIAGYRPGFNYMGSFGYQLPFALAENEEKSPWEPFHVEHGFERNVSTVTAGGTVIWGSPPAPHSKADKSGAETALELLCIQLAERPVIGRLQDQGPKGMRNMITLLIAPPVAKALADAGYSKQDIKEYLYENARVPLRKLEWLVKYTFAEPITLRDKVEAGLILSKEYLGEPDDMVRILPSPELVHIVVCGDPGRNRVMTLDGCYVLPTTKEIKLPANWDELLKEVKK